MIEELPTPEPGKGEVRIKVAACGINFPDSLIIEDKYQVKPPRPFSPGAEVSGVVDAVGEGVTAVTVGQKVIGSAAFGGLSEMMVVPAARCLPMPDGMPFETAAALHHDLRHLLPHALKQPWTSAARPDPAGARRRRWAWAWRRWRSARRSAPAWSPPSHPRRRRRWPGLTGPTPTVVYPHGPFDKDGLKALSAQFKDAVGPEGAHVIYDPVGGDYAEPALRAIAWGGSVPGGGLPRRHPQAAAQPHPAQGVCDICGVFWGAFVARDPKTHQTNVAEMMALYAQGKLKPEVSQVFPFGRAADAITLLADRKALGKVVVKMDAG